jgi:hypothetical protein
LRHTDIVLDAGGANLALSWLGTDMRYQGRTADRELARVARASHGVVRREQLMALGLSKSEITTHLAACDAFVWRGVPVTSVARTVVDPASVLCLNALARGFHEAAIKYGTTPAEVQAVLERRSNSRGAANLRAVIHGDEPVLLSALERRFRRLLRDAGLPLPETNRAADGRLIDCRWPEHRLTVELDGYRFHRSRYAWERDRRREREARARGDDFRRFTYGDVEQPGAMLAELSFALS